VFAVEIIGHRGASYDAPENTVTSIRLAYQQGADAAEIDIQLTKDGRIVVMHDDTTERTGGPKWKIADKTLSELRALDVGRWKAPAYEGQRIPTLEEILAVVPKGKRLFVEIKCGPEVLPELVRVLREAGRPAKEIVIIGFDLGTMREAKQRMPERPTYWLYGTSPARDKKTGKTHHPPEQLLAICRNAGLDGLDVKFDSRLTRGLVDKLHRLGLKLYVWTVDDAEEAKRLAALKVDGITTDRPGWLREQLGGGGEKLTN
jgi:glycerophosphoryl diester phosphodiesterase